MKGTLFFGAMLLVMSACGLCAQALSPDYDAIVARAIDTHILPRFADLAEQASNLHAATIDCGANEAPLTAAYHKAFDAWMGVSHLRLGPSEENDFGIMTAAAPAAIAASRSSSK